MPVFSKFANLAGQGIVIGLVTFVLVEGAFRIYHYFNPSFIFYDRSYNRFRGQPGAPEYDFNLNSGGFKDVEFKPEKEAGAYRILALGDSFAFGVVPYQHNYLTLLEERLHAKGRRTEVLNLGIPSIGPQHYLALLAEEGLPLQPDMALVSFFIGNDITDTMRGARNFYEYSAAATFLKYLVDLQRKFEGRVIHGQAVYDDDFPTFTDEAYLDIAQSRSAIYRKRESSRPVRAFDEAVGYLARIKEWCELHGIALMVAFIPDELQVNQPLQSRVLAALGAGPDELDFALPNKFLSEHLRVQGIDHFDFLDGFRAASTETNLYKPNDSHWNIAGNRLAADLLAVHLAGRLSP